MYNCTLVQIKYKLRLGQNYLWNKQSVTTLSGQASACRLRYHGDCFLGARRGLYHFLKVGGCVFELFVSYIVVQSGLDWHVCFANSISNLNPQLLFWLTFLTFIHHNWCFTHLSQVLKQVYNYTLATSHCKLSLQRLCDAFLPVLNWWSCKMIWTLVPPTQSFEV